MAENAFEKKPYAQRGRCEETPSRAPCQQAAQLCHRGSGETGALQRDTGARGDAETVAQGPEVAGPAKRRCATPRARGSTWRKQGGRERSPARCQTKEAPAAK